MIHAAAAVVNAVWSFARDWPLPWLIIEKDPDRPEITIPFEFLREIINPGQEIILVDIEGQEVARSRVNSIKSIKANDRTILIKVQVPKEVAKRVSGLRLQPKLETAEENYVERMADEAIICRCERVTAGEIRQLIKDGVRDINEIKTITRASMGPWRSQNLHSPYSSSFPGRRCAGK